jgi:hypothetical protein
MVLLLGLWLLPGPRHHSFTTQRNHGSNQHPCPYPTPTQPTCPAGCLASAR